jgi:hypothetical protein
MKGAVVAEETPEELQARQVAEYGQFVAVQPIYYDGALAYAPGHPVPASNVEAHGYLAAGQVERVATKTEAKKAAADAVDTKKG